MMSYFSLTGWGAAQGQFKRLWEFWAHFCLCFQIQLLLDWTLTSQLWKQKSVFASVL